MPVSKTVPCRPGLPLCLHLECLFLDILIGVYLSLLFQAVEKLLRMTSDLSTRASPYMLLDLDPLLSE